jgi:hypothetical protein
MLHRILAAMALAAGLFLAHVGLYEPLHAMSQHASAVKVGTFSIVFAPLTVVFGALYLVFGERVGEVIGHPDEAPARLFVFIAMLLLLGVGAKVWLNHQVSAGGYGPPVHLGNVTLTMPVVATFGANSLDVVDKYQAAHRIVWQDLASIQIKAVPDDHAPSYTIYWELTGRDNHWTAVPLEATGEQAMLEAIREHAGPILRDPVKDMRQTIQTAQGRAIWSHVVWVRP